MNNIILIPLEDRDRVIQVLSFFLLSHIDKYLCICYCCHIDKHQYEVSAMAKIDEVLICKALGDPNRMEIVKMLSDQEKCGCKLLEKFDITQPTLSHHMKILVDSGLVNDRKEGKWHYYSINTVIMKEFCGFIKTLCNETTGKCCKGGS